MERNRGLAAEAALMLLDAWQTEIAGLPEQRAAMASIRVPKAPAELGRLLHDRLLDKHRIQVPFFTIMGTLWLRISAQAYNEISDYHRLANAVPEEIAAIDT